MIGYKKTSQKMNRGPPICEKKTASTNCGIILDFDPRPKTLKILYILSKDSENLEKSNQGQS